jgi:NAD(P)-dependent dehydrogenase (short-subunit alcohol dehydrogenase family)
MLVTGSTGIAAAAAFSFAREGARILVASRTAANAQACARAIEAAGGEAAWSAGDLAGEGVADQAVQMVTERWGRLDGVYNVAGISGRGLGDGPLHECSLEGWEGVLRANLRSQFLVCRAAIRQMLGQERDADGLRGSILTMSSILAQRPAPEHFATHAYAASKGGIESLTRAAAAYYAPDGIRVNAIAPSLVATPMSRRAQSSPAIQAYLEEKQPLAGGPIDAEDLVETAILLLGPGGRRITGQIVAVDAGWTVSEPRVGHEARSPAD